MALSKRERIVRDILAAVQSLDWVTTVVRRPYAWAEELDGFAQTQFPVVSALAHLPKPVQERRAGAGKEFVSTLDVDIYVFALEAATPDATLSQMLDGLWQALFADRRRGGLAMDTTVLPETEAAHRPPYVGAWLRARITYVHDHTGM